MLVAANGSYLCLCLSLTLSLTLSLSLSDLASATVYLADTIRLQPALLLHATFLQFVNHCLRLYLPSRFRPSLRSTLLMAKVFEFSSKRKSKEEWNELWPRLPARSPRLPRLKSSSQLLATRFRLRSLPAPKHCHFYLPAAPEQSKALRATLRQRGTSINIILLDSAICTRTTPSGYNHYLLPLAARHIK